MLNFLFLTVAEVYGVLVLFSDAVYDIRHPIFNLLLYALDALFLFVGQVEACLQRVGAASVYLDELLVLEELLFGDEAGAGGEVLLGSIIVPAEVVPPMQTCSIVVALPCDELHTMFAVHSRKHSAIEFCQQFVLVLQSNCFQRRSQFHLLHILRGTADDPVGFVLCGLTFRGCDVFTSIGDSANLADFTEGLIVQPDTERAAQNRFSMEAFTVEGESRFGEIHFLLLCVHINNSF